MRQPYVTVVLVVGLLLGGVLLSGSAMRLRLPGDQQGYAPEQPIAFSHRLHADELQINCQYCHAAAGESRHAGIPSGEACMRCHKFVTAAFNVMQEEALKADEEKRKPRPVVSAELRKLYDAMGLDDALQPTADKSPHPIRWVRVHNLPDFVYFDHRAHVAAGVTCQYCHGPVESMQTVEQFSTLSMGWCVNCHRDATAHGVQGKSVNPSTDCATCHY
ncbi:MAG: cytochrome c3 family protein [Pirellulales bacterium]